MAVYEYASGTYLTFRETWSVRINAAKAEVTRLNSVIRELSGQTGFGVATIRDQLTYIRNGLNRQIDRMRDLAEVWDFIHNQTTDAEGDARGIIKKILPVIIPPVPPVSLVPGVIDAMKETTEEIKNEIDAKVEQEEFLRNWESFTANIIKDESDVGGFSYSFGCTWYTAKKMMLLGIHIPTMKINEKTGWRGDGCVWYDSFLDKEPQGDSYGQKLYPGADCLQNLLNDSKNRPVYNIVLSFPTSKDSDPLIRKCGHVMMIDAIIDGIIYFSDNSDPGNPKTLSIDNFIAKYKNYNGDPIGAVHFYR